jgi:hypothetical protein
MHNLISKNKNNSKVRATTTLVLLGAILIVAGVSAPLAITNLLQSAEAVFDGATGAERKPPAAPSVVSGDNIYIAWWNGTAGQPDVQTDVMFRASTDGGATFTDKINLSNTREADSWNVEIHGEGETVVVSWWETNQTSDIPVARVSNDAGETFGPLMMLGMNGTISTAPNTTGAAEGEEAGEETEEEEAVEGGAEE